MAAWDFVLILTTSNLPWSICTTSLCCPNQNCLRQTINRSTPHFILPVSTLPTNISKHSYTTIRNLESMISPHNVLCGSHKTCTYAYTTILCMIAQDLDCYVTLRFHELDWVLKTKQTVQTFNWNRFKNKQWGMNEIPRIECLQKLSSLRVVIAEILHKSALNNLIDKS